ncbi:MAG: ABC transporter ATP-binding protein [Candidatus Altiarchaeales archaeon]|nr:ABC transporter ATP-binding protein [Candidatus Altiarchaeales archaeon]
MDRKNTVLSGSGLTVSYGSNVVLEGIGFSVKEGEFVAVVGESGCGKTTLLNAIAGFVSFSGVVDKPKKIGVVFQNYAVFPWLTVEENIAFGLEGDDAAVEHYLAMIGLDDKREGYPFELSGGQVQRVALARTLAASPELILMDEPYGALDVYTRDRMQRWLLDVWRKEKKTIVFVTHSIDEAVFLADRVLMLKNKRIAGEFPVKFRRPRSKEIKYSKRFAELKKTIMKAINED